MIRNLNKWLIIAIIAILTSGMVLTLWTIQREDTLLRADLLTKTRLMQGGIDTGHVKALTGTEADLVSPDYQALKGQMIQVQSADPQIRPSSSLSTPNLRNPGITRRPGRFIPKHLLSC
jgi:hypothetical protein